MSVRLPPRWDSPGKNTGGGCHFLLQCMKVKSESEVAQSCPTLSDPADCSLPGSSVHGIFQARVLEWGATAYQALIVAHGILSGSTWTVSCGLWDLVSWPETEPGLPALGALILATRPPGKSLQQIPHWKCKTLLAKDVVWLQCIKKQRHHFADKDPYNQSYAFPAVKYGWEIQINIILVEHNKLGHVPSWKKYETFIF